jgi:hypothetical protein
VVRLLRPLTVWNLYLWLTHVFANGGCAGDKLRDARVEVGDVRIAPLGWYTPVNLFRREIK